MKMFINKIKQYLARKKREVNVTEHEMKNVPVAKYFPFIMFELTVYSCFA